MTDPAWITQFNGPDGLRDTSEFTYATNEPPAGYQYFGAGSPWNTPVPASPLIDANSTNIITWLNTTGGANGPLDRYTGGGQNAGADYDYPLYHAHADDPLTRVKIHSGGRDTSNEGYNRHGEVTKGHNTLIRIPAVALPAGGTDGILSVMTGSKIIDLWQGKNWTPGTGKIGCQWATYATRTGNGMPDIPYGVSSSGMSCQGGNIRIADLNAGRIPHAIRIIAKYVRKNTFQAPCNGAALYDPAVTQGDTNDLARPVTGSRIWWSLTDASTNALAIPDWKKVILRALHEFGGIITDTNSAHSWNWTVEDGTVDVAYGNQDRWKTYAIAQGWSPVGGADPNYVMPCSTGVDWSNMRMLDPANFSF